MINVSTIKSQSKSWRWVSSVGLIALFALTLELAARVDDWARYDAAFFEPYEFDRLFQLTSGGLRGVPNARFTKWALNADGLRGANLQPEQGQIRVVAYGASETFGMFEDSGKEFPRALEKALNENAKNEHFEVLNAGMPGMRIGSGIGLFNELAQKFKPRAVVIYPTPTHYIGVSEPYCRRVPNPGKKTSREYWPQLRIADKLREEVKRVLPAKIQHATRKALINWHARNLVPIERLPETSIKAFEKDLLCALEGAKAKGMIPILVTHANRFGETVRPDESDRLTQWRQQYPEMMESGFIDLEKRANNSIRAVAASERIELVDADAALSGNPKWFADHAHFNNDGAAQMGALLAPAVLKSLAQAHP
jgi:hypothetical protein